MRFCSKCGNTFPDGMESCLIDGTPLERVGDLLLGKLVGGCYRISSRIASGGMGTVYVGKHEYLDRPVAVKVLKPEFVIDEESRQRVIREGRICATIEHAHIVKAYDLVTEGPVLYLVMELLEGESLRGRLARAGRLDLRSALGILSMTAEGLASAHALEVVHRDLKPSNIFLTRQRGTDDWVKLLDFGIAFVLGENRLTRQGGMVGTPAYMPPELFRGGAPTKASDVYSLACLAYKMLAGHTPFGGGELADVISGHLTREAPPLSAMCPEVPADLDRILARMLAKNPEDRFDDAFGLLHALREGGFFVDVSADRVSEVGTEPVEVKESNVAVELGAYFGSLAGEDGDGTERSSSFRQGVEAADRLLPIEQEKRETIAALERIEGKRRSYQKNIGNAISSLSEDLSRVRDEWQAGKIEYLKMGAERDFVKQEVGRLVREAVLHGAAAIAGAGPDGEVDAGTIERVLAAGEAARRHQEIERRTEALSRMRAEWRGGIRELKFQIEELTRRNREVEEECTAEYERHRSRLEALSARSEELREAVTAAALEYRSEKP